MDRQSIRLMTFPTHTIIIVKIPSISLCGFFARNSPSENYRLGYHIFSCTQNVALLQKIGSLFRLFFCLVLKKSCWKVPSKSWEISDRHSQKLHLMRTKAIFFWKTKLEKDLNHLYNLQQKKIVDIFSFELKNKNSLLVIFFFSFYRSVSKQITNT